jgi:hypothetical protein
MNIRPTKSLISLLAPASRRTFTAAAWPPVDASISGVHS